MGIEACHASGKQCPARSLNAAILSISQSPDALLVSKRAVVSLQPPFPSAIPVAIEMQRLTTDFRWPSKKNRDAFN
jgi:hypothetical protein